MSQTLFDLEEDQEAGRWEVPSEWSWTTIGQDCEYVQRGKSPKYTDFSELPVINQKCIRWDILETEHLKYIHPHQWEKWNEVRFLRPDDILLNSTGVGTVGRAYHYRAPTPLEKAVVDSHVTILRPGPDVVSRYLWYFLRSPAVQSKIEDLQTGSTGQVELGKKVIEAIAFPRPDPITQRAIVSKIDELFSDIEAGERALKRARRALERYRKSVLKAAVTGELTADWREANKDKLEPASALLDRLPSAEETASAANKPKKTKKRSPEAEHALSEARLKLANLIPEAWTTVRVGDIANQITKGSSPKWQGFEYTEGGVSFVRSQNIGWGRVSRENIAYVDRAFNEKNSRSIIREGDLLLNLVGASVGRAAIAPPEFDGANSNQAVASVRIPSSSITNFALLFLLSPMGQETIHTQKVDVARANFNLNQIADLTIPLPSEAEIIELLSGYRAELSRIDHAEEVIDAELRRSSALRQSVLKAAFSGHLRITDTLESLEAA